MFPPLDPSQAPFYVVVKPSFRKNPVNFFGEPSLGTAGLRFEFLLFFSFFPCSPRGAPTLLDIIWGLLGTRHLWVIHCCVSSVSLYRLELRCLQTSRSAHPRSLPRFVTLSLLSFRFACPINFFFVCQNKASESYNRSRPCSICSILQLRRWCDTGSPPPPPPFFFVVPPRVLVEPRFYSWTQTNFLGVGAPGRGRPSLPLCVCVPSSCDLLYLPKL